ncbi:hypothetical protein BX266_5524 [Streptomyces sp. TLI_171]|nr:hypothetical protein BX266_5524 [Streptomyces sp. TLI_171]
MATSPPGKRTPLSLHAARPPVGGTIRTRPSHTRHRSATLPPPRPLTRKNGEALLEYYSLCGLPFDRPTLAHAPSPKPPPCVPPVVGVDDFALKPRHRHRDRDHQRETGKRVDVVPGRRGSLPGRLGPPRRGDPAGPTRRGTAQRQATSLVEPVRQGPDRRPLCAAQLPYLHAFANGLELDRAAVDASLTLPHHNGRGGGREHPHQADHGFKGCTKISAAQFNCPLRHHRATGRAERCSTQERHSESAPNIGSLPDQETDSR